MKKAFKSLLASLVLVPVVAFNSCVVSITCISHIDRDQNGICDNGCGTEMEIVIQNVEKVTVKTMPTKTYYAFNEPLDLTGGVVEIEYNDGTPNEEISMDDERLVIKAPSMDSAGLKSVAVEFNGMRTTFQIEVGLAKFDVSFDLGYDGADEIPTQTVTINENATRPANPVRSGYDFVNWYADENFETLFNFEMTPINAATTIYAKWVKKYKVTYDANYANGDKQVRETVNGRVTADVEPAERDGYTFAGWYVDSNATTPFEFDQIITKDTTVYAKWVSQETTMYTVTFNENYGETPATSSTRVAEGAKVARPAAPSRAAVTTKGHQVSEYKFLGWYTDAACTTEFNFNSEINEDVTVYAKWSGNYIFEAEHVMLIDFTTGAPLAGMGASGGSEGANMVDPPRPGREGINASNGYYVTYLYKEGLELRFMIESDREVEDATLIFRITAETRGYAITSYIGEGETEIGTRWSQYDMMLNGEYLDYGIIEILDVGVQENEATGGQRPFSDHTIAVNLKLKKGTNEFRFITANSNGMGGTMAGTAPVVDCIKIQTSAELSWTPTLTNEDRQ